MARFFCVALLIFVQAPARGACPPRALAPSPLPFSRSEHDSVEFWLSKLSLAQRQSPVMTRAQIEAHNRRVARLHVDGWPRGRFDLLAVSMSHERLKQQLARGLSGLGRKVARGEAHTVADTSPRALLARLGQELAAMRPVSELRLVHVPAALRAYPTSEGLYEDAEDLAFDMLQRAPLRAGELVRVFFQGGAYCHVWTSYAQGFVAREALGPPLTHAQARAYLEAEARVVVTDDQAVIESEDGKPVGVTRMGVVLPMRARVGERFAVSFPGPSGLGETWLASTSAARLGDEALTREALWRRAFELLETPYGFGGVGGERDCSLLLMDLFATFGVTLPRSAAWQAFAGVSYRDVAGLSEAHKLAAIEEAAREALVLLYLPGHIMLYLGRDGDHAYALHAISGYLVPCAEGGETMMRIDRTKVTSLALGLGSSRKSLLERVSRLVLFER